MPEPTEDLKLTVYTQDGEAHPVEVPPDIQTTDFIRELIEGLRLPMTNAEQQRVVWKLHDKHLARELDPDRSLRDNGVRTGHEMMLRRDVTAGA
jgi:hypothetical protein